MEKDKEVTQLKIEIANISARISEIFAILKDMREQIQKYFEDHDKLIIVERDVEEHKKNINYIFEKARVAESRISSVERWMSSAKVYLTLLAIIISTAISFVVYKVLDKF